MMDIHIKTANGYARVKVPTLEDPVWRMSSAKPVTYWRLIDGQEADVVEAVQAATEDVVHKLTVAAMKHSHNMEQRKRLCAGAARLLGEIAGEVGDHSRTPAP